MFLLQHQVGGAGHFKIAPLLSWITFNNQSIRYALVSNPDQPICQIFLILKSQICVNSLHCICDVIRRWLDRKLPNWHVSYLITRLSKTD